MSILSSFSQKHRLVLETQLTRQMEPEIWPVVRLTCTKGCLKTLLQSKLFDHDNMKFLKKLLDELENVMDQVETELQRRVEETPGTQPHKLITSNQ